MSREFSVRAWVRQVSNRFIYPHLTPVNKTTDLIIRSTCFRGGGNGQLYKL